MKCRLPTAECRVLQSPPMLLSATLEELADVSSALLSSCLAHCSRTAGGSPTARASTSRVFVLPSCWLFCRSALHPAPSTVNSALSQLSLPTRFPLPSPVFLSPLGVSSLCPKDQSGFAIPTRLVGYRSDSPMRRAHASSSPARDRSVRLVHALALANQMRVRTRR